MNYCVKCSVKSIQAIVTGLETEFKETCNGKFKSLRGREREN
jgi:hypothetical protein